MFKITQNPTFSAVVQLTVLGAEEIGIVPMTFKNVTNEQLAKLEADIDTASKSGLTDADILDRVIADWADLVGADEQPLAYSKPALCELLSNHPIASVEIWRQYKAARLESRVKN